MTEPAEFRDLFSRAKAIATWEAVSGVKLYPAGKSKRGECPLCHAGQKKGAGGPFWVRGGSWGCFACKGEAGAGDIIDLEAELGRCTPMEAAARIVGVSGEPWKPRAIAAPGDSKSAPASRDSAAPAAWIERLLEEAHPILGTGAEVYLRGRGIFGPLIATALTSGRLLFHHSVPWRDLETGKVSRFPAMLAMVETPSGFTGGIHATYLTRRPDRTWAKAPVIPAKRMHGPQQDASGRPGGCWVVGEPGGDGPVIVAEGIETATSLAILQGDYPCRVLAALSLGRLQGGWKLDAYGRLNPEMVEGDPERPALTWPGVDDVTIAVDHDMKPIKVKSRKAGGGAYERELNASDRARICAGLAVQAWRRAGTATVRSVAPPVGLDFNDELMARVGD